MPQGKHTFQLHILSQDWSDLQLGYEYGQAFVGLESAVGSQALFVITPDEIASYDWKTQSITLTPPATDIFLQALPQNEQLKEFINSLNQLKESLGWGNPVERALYTKGFLVTVDGQLRYGGIFLDATSQMAINYPVIRTEITRQGQVVFRLLPLHLPFFTHDPIAEEDTPMDEVVAKEAAQDWAAFPESMKDAFLRLASTSKAQAFRNLIRDPQIRDKMKDWGKLL